MADNTTESEDLIANIEKTTPSKPAAAAGTVAAALPVVVGARHLPAPMRLSKGQRKHIRRLKEAGEFKPTVRRR